jgi:Glyoxalase superfamily protein
MCPSWPLRRILSRKKAAEFYFGVHGFGLDWPDEAFTTGSGGVPDAQVSRGESVLDLSERHGDGSPGMVALRAGQVMESGLIV